MTIIKRPLAVASLGTLMLAATAWAFADTAMRQPGETLANTPMISASLRGEWVLHEGMTAIDFNLPLLDNLGLQLHSIDTTADPVNPRLFGFRVDTPAQLAFDGVGGGFESLRSATLPHRGGVVFRTETATVAMKNFVLQKSLEPGTLALLNSSGQTLFTLVNPHLYRDAVSGEFFVMQMDLRLGKQLAGQLGTPEFEDLVVGIVDLTMKVSPASADAAMEPEAGECIADFGDDVVDVELMEMSQIGQIARVPGDRVAFAPSAKLGNVGDNDIRWFWAIPPPGFNGPNIGSHPYLVMNFYRIADGMLEQVGASELKHAWNTINLGCSCPGGQVMFVGCVDVYGVGNNGNQYYFGPRDELVAHTGEFTSLGSHFDAIPVDDFRDHGNSPLHPVLEHRLTVPEADLSTPGAEYLVEAWYIVAGDRDPTNNIGFRRVSQTLIADVWDFVYVDSVMTLGPAIDGWVDPLSPGPLASNRRLDTATGRVQLASRVTDLGDGQYRYHYALMNLDFDRQISAVTFPLPPGGVVSEITFADADDDDGNNWSSTVNANTLVFGAEDDNALDWGTLYRFSFDANVAPADTGIRLQAFEAGDADYLVVTAQGPVATGTADTDADGIVDSGDNCTLVANASQRDTDGDGYGNACDPDLNGDLLVNLADLALMKAAFFSNGDVDADLTGDGTVNFSDLLSMKALFFAPPGPSGIAGP